MSKRIILATVTVLIFNTPAFTDIPRCEEYIKKCENTTYKGNPYNTTDDTPIGTFCDAILPPTLFSSTHDGISLKICPEKIVRYIENQDENKDKTRLNYGITFNPTHELCEAIFKETKGYMHEFFLCEY